MVSAEFLEVTLRYSECKTFGLAAEAFEATYDLFAGESGAKPTTPPFIELLRTMKITSGGGVCVVTFPIEGPENEKLKPVKYKTFEEGTVKAIEVQPAIEGMTSVGSGAGCKYAKESNGKYSGAWSLKAADGVTAVEWK